MTQKLLMMLTPIALVAIAIGCDERSVRLAEEAAQRQADQNHEMARLNQGLLKAADHLHQEWSELNEGRDHLEAERRAIAGARRTESMLAALFSASGAGAAALFALALTWLILFGLRRADDSTELACQLLVEDLTSPAPQLSRRDNQAAPPLLSQEPPAVPREERP